MQEQFYFNNIDWFEERIPRIEKNNGLYKFVCLLFLSPRKGIKYKTMFLILYGVNKRHLGENEAKRRAMEEIINIYKFNERNGQK